MNYHIPSTSIHHLLFPNFLYLSLYVVTYSCFVVLNNLKVSCRYDSVFLNFSVGKHTFYTKPHCRRCTEASWRVLRVFSTGIHLNVLFVALSSHFWTINWQIMHLFSFSFSEEKETGEFLYVRIWGGIFIFWNRHTFSKIALLRYYSCNIKLSFKVYNYNMININNTTFLLYMKLVENVDPEASHHKGKIFFFNFVPI